ncbi:hypothetical protein K2X30_13615 [bacterium]|nr:hypothetical protein [bacterium]
MKKQYNRFWIFSVISSVASVASVVPMAFNDAQAAPGRPNAGAQPVTPGIGAGPSRAPDRSSDRPSPRDTRPDNRGSTTTPSTPTRPSTPTTPSVPRQDTTPRSDNTRRDNDRRDNDRRDNDRRGGGGVHVPTPTAPNHGNWNNSGPNVGRPGPHAGAQPVFPSTPSFPHNPGNIGQPGPHAPAQPIFPNHGNWGNNGGWRDRDHNWGDRNRWDRRWDNRHDRNDWNDRRDWNDNYYPDNGYTDPGYTGPVYSEPSYNPDYNQPNYDSGYSEPSYGYSEPSNTPDYYSSPSSSEPTYYPSNDNSNYVATGEPMVVDGGVIATIPWNNMPYYGDAKNYPNTGTLPGSAAHLFRGPGNTPVGGQPTSMGVIVERSVSALIVGTTQISVLESLKLSASLQGRKLLGVEVQGSAVNGSVSMKLMLNGQSLGAQGVGQNGDLTLPVNALIDPSQDVKLIITSTGSFQLEKLRVYVGK